MNQRILKLIGQAIFSSIIFIAVFQINEKISLPLVAFGAGVLIFHKKIKFFYEDAFVFAFLGLMIMFSAINITSSGLLYIFSFFTTILIFSKPTGAIVQYFDYKKLLYTLTLIVNCYIIYEFITRNFIPSLFIELPRARVEEISASFLGLLIRARGFAEEPGHMGLFYELIFPIIFIEVTPSLNKKQKFFLYLTTFLALFSIFSAFTTTVIFMYLSIYLLVKLELKQRILIIFSGLTLFTILLATIPNLQLFLQLAFESVINKVTYDPNNPSAGDRLSRINDALTLYNDHIMGIGAMNMRYYSSFPSSLNLYLDILLFFGPITLIIFLLYLLTIAIKAFKINRWSYFSSFILLTSHYLVIANFWYPFLWILIGLIQYTYYNKNMLIKQ